MSARAALLLAFAAALLPLLLANPQEPDTDDKLLADARRMLDGNGPPFAVRPPGEPDPDAQKRADPADGGGDADAGDANNNNNDNDTDNNNINKVDDKRAADANPDDPDNNNDNNDNENNDKGNIKDTNDRDIDAGKRFPGTEYVNTKGMPSETVQRFRDLLQEAAKLAPNAFAAEKLQHVASHTLTKHTGRTASSDDTAKLERQLAAAKKLAAQLKSTLESERNSFKRGLEMAREERRSEMDEMRTTIDEQKHAFDELYEEKRFMSHVLEREQKTLRELQRKIQHPDLGLWIRQRAERAAIMMETPETGAVKFYARKFMAPKVDKMRHKIETLERRVERSVDHLLPARYGSVVAVLLSIGLIAFPLAVSVSTIVSWSKQMSLRQYVLLGNVFLSAFAIALVVAGLILRQDPLQTLYEAGESLFIALQMLAALAFPCFLAVLLGAVARSRDRLDMFVFGCEFVFYVLVGLNYRMRVWRPAMLGEHIETTPMMYFVYLMDFISMTALTVSSSRMDPAVMQAWREMESGVVGTYAAATSYASGAGKVAGSAAAAAAASAANAAGAVAQEAVGDDVEAGMKSRGGTQQRAMANGTASRAMNGTRPLSGRSASGGGLAKLSGGMLKKVGSALQMQDSNEKDE